MRKWNKKSAGPSEKAELKIVRRKRIKSQRKGNTNSWQKYVIRATWIPNGTNMATPFCSEQEDMGNNWRPGPPERNGKPLLTNNDQGVFDFAPGRNRKRDFQPSGEGNLLHPPQKKESDNSKFETKNRLLPLNAGTWIKLKKRQRRTKKII